MNSPHATAILVEVNKLAASPPAKVTQQDLESLAKLCSEALPDN